MPVEDEHFFFAVYIDIAEKTIFSVDTESNNKVCLIITSESLTSEELRSFTKFEATRYFNKGDLKTNGKAKHQFSCVEYIPNPEPDGFEDKLNKLLAFLERDQESILNLGKHAKVYIDVTMDFHAGNQLLGNVFLDLKTIKRMSDLNLEINFDFAAWGNHFK